MDTHDIVDMSTAQLPLPGAYPFRLVRFMKSNVLSRQDIINCWKVFDLVYDNLADDNGVTRSLPAIEQVIGQPLRNPVLTNNHLLGGVNFPRAVYNWCLERMEEEVLDEAIARLGQNKPFLIGLEQYLTDPERENRQAKPREKEAEPIHRPLPENLVTSSSDVLALLHWYRSVTNRPVPANADNIPANFNQRRENAQRFYAAMEEEPEDMVERPDSDSEESDDSEEDKEKKNEEEKEVHPQVQRARHMSKLTKFALSWDIEVSSQEKGTILQAFELAVADLIQRHIEREQLGIPNTAPHSHATYPRVGRRVYKPLGDRVQAVEELLSVSYHQPGCG